MTIIKRTPSLPALQIPASGSTARGPVTHTASASPQISAAHGPLSGLTQSIAQRQEGSSPSFANSSVPSSPMSPARPPSPLPLVNNVLQPPDKKRISHPLSSLNDGSANLKSGTYEFVVPHDQQDTAFVRKPSNNGGGHTSMIGPEKNVAYAGTLEYKKGSGLEKWDNNSGHYRPPSPKASRIGLNQEKFQSLSTQSRMQAEQAAAAAKAGHEKRDNVMGLLKDHKSALDEVRKHPENSLERRKARKNLTDTIHSAAQAQGLNYSKGELDKLIPELADQIT